VAPVPNHWTPWESDFSRAAWQIHNSSYVILDGVRTKGAYGRASDTIAGVRFLQTDHFTIRHSILQKNWDGVEGNGTDTVIEYDTFLANGYPGEDQQHQFYDTKVTISPPVITTSTMMDAICVDRTSTRDRGIPIFTAIGFRMPVTMSGI
jgi:hypothetical protein